jgi:sulfite reductase alpha subunit-like flavoprotein
MDLTRAFGPRRASTKLISKNSEDIRKILNTRIGETRMVEKICCGGGCCLQNALESRKRAANFLPVTPPDNEAFRNLKIDVQSLSMESVLEEVEDPPKNTLTFESWPALQPAPSSSVDVHPPKFVQPHPPYDVYSAPIQHARALTKPGAPKRTYHLDLDVTDYPTEGGDVDFVAGGAIGVCVPNSDEVVNEVFDLLKVTDFLRDRPIKLKTEGGRWPTIWGDEKPRELTTSRRELLTWCTDLQSYPPTKPIFRLLAEYATADNERKILTYLASGAGQAAFCDIRNGPHITFTQLLHAFPSAKPPLSHTLSTLQQLMPRFYSLSNDPHVSRVPNAQQGPTKRRIVEIAVSVHETPNWDGNTRTGVGSGFLERCAQKAGAAVAAGIPVSQLELRVPMFRGLMANPLARDGAADGPLLLIGAGVGVAPFRGVIQSRLKKSNCANKVWLMQGIRDSLLDEIYSGEWGVDEEEVKKVVQSRGGDGRYVQEEVRREADLVWFVINSLEGRICVCGSGKGMGEGVEAALVDVAIDKGTLNLHDAKDFWQKKKAGGQYITVSRESSPFDVDADCS